MKRLSLILLIAGFSRAAFAQMVINDQSIRYQQERMVFKQWDRNKFTPKPGFLYTNPLYWLTWAWHTDYKDRDLRPLSATGPQTQRLALVAAMQNTDNAYKLQSDTLGNTAVSEAVNYSGLTAKADPLWLLYYRHEFAPLLDQNDQDLLNGLPAKERDYLSRTGVLDWYREESAAIRERLDAAMSTTLDRGSRILACHRLLLEYHKIAASWEAKKQYARKFLSLSGTAVQIRKPESPIHGSDPSRSDKQIAEDILRNSKL